jgi:hypothetical protein
MRPALLVCPTLLLAVACANSGSSAPTRGGDDSGGSGSSGASSSSGSTSSASGSSGGASGSSSSGGATSSGGNGSDASGGSSGGSSGGTDGGVLEGGGADGATAGDGGAVCSALPLCDGFEADTPGMQPSASRWTVVMGCNPIMQDTAVDGGLLVGVDNSQAHTGKNSLRVVGGDSCGYYVTNTTALSNAKLAGGPLYVRFYARFSGPPTPNHNGFLSMATGATGDAGGDHIRLGFQDQVIAWNAQNSDSTLPDMDPQGTTLSTTTSPNNWDCFEFSVDYKAGDIQFWLNGMPIQGLSFAASQTAVQGVDDQWARGGPKVPIAVTSFGIGWLGLNNQYTAWFDDIALGNARIGCQ